MRKIDRKLNMQKANLLAENLYLKSKTNLNEQDLIIPDNMIYKVVGYDGNNIKIKGDEITIKFNKFTHKNKDYYLYFEAYLIQGEFDVDRRAFKNQTNNEELFYMDDNGNKFSIPEDQKNEIVSIIEDEIDQIIGEYYKAN